MKNQSKVTRFLTLSLAVCGFVFLSGNVAETSAQNRDPFAKPGWAKPKTQNPTTATTTVKQEKPTKPIPAAIMPVPVPDVNLRIAYFKRLREEAVLNNQEIPKVTSIMTLDELVVTGIFRTPRGYAAMVEAKPIKLSYTIYPGEKFFDGQLVAIEENKLVFRKVTKMSNNKFVASVENKPLREYTFKEEVQGTAPVQPTTTPVQPQQQPSGNTEVATTVPVNAQPAQMTTNVPPVVPSVIISPLDEMNKQPADQPKKEDAAQKNKKKTKVANNKK